MKLTSVVCLFNEGVAGGKCLLRKEAKTPHKKKLFKPFYFYYLLTSVNIHFLLIGDEKKNVIMEALGKGPHSSSIALLSHSLALFLYLNSLFLKF